MAKSETVTIDGDRKSRKSIVHARKRTVAAGRIGVVS
jgi:hypothetical protein